MQFFFVILICHNLTIKEVRLGKGEKEIIVDQVLGAKLLTCTISLIKGLLLLII